MQRRELKNYFKDNQAMCKLTARNANAFASTFYFFADTQGNAKKIKRACKPTLPIMQGFVRTSNSGALNVNRLEQSVCELQTMVLRGQSRTAYNIKLKEINFEKLNLKIK